MEVTVDDTLTETLAHGLTKIEPGSTYCVVLTRSIPPAEAEALTERFEELTGATLVLLTGIS